MPSTTRISRVLTLVGVLINFVLLGSGFAQAKFLKADLRWTNLRKAEEDKSTITPSLTDLLAFRDTDQDPVFEKAMRLIDNLAVQSDCHQAAAAQLLITCKAVGADLVAREEQGQGQHELLERAKSVYAVRLAVCETREGKAAIPSTCKPILTIPQRRLVHHELDVVNSKNLASCLEALMVEHYYWTSYSNSRQDANTLCQASTLEADRLGAIHSYQKLAELLPEFRDALTSTRSQWLDFLRQQRSDVEHLRSLRVENEEELKTHRQIEQGFFQKLTKTAKQGVEDLSQVMHRAMANTGTEVTRTHEAVGNLLADFTKLGDLLLEIKSSAQHDNAQVAAAHASDMAKIHEIALVTTDALKHLNPEDLARGVGELVHRLREDMGEVAAAQSAQLAAAQNQLRLGQDLSEAQRESLALGRQIRDSSASLTSNLDLADAAAGRVSSRLDKVNQALTRVEKASAVVGGLLALITIPMQLLDNLHLKLLVVFAMPALVLAFWKPRKYSYSLIAVYVFLESLVSLLAEYRQAIGGVCQRVFQHSRAILQLTTLQPVVGGWRLTPPLAIAAAIAILAIGSHLVRRHFFARRPPTPKRSPTRPTKSRIPSVTDDLNNTDAIAERYFHEYRLRNGRPLPHPDSDRFRRAATVC